MKQLNWDLKQMVKDNPDGSRSTQAGRWEILDLSGCQLEEMGFKNMRKHSLKPRHVETLVHRWQEEGLAIGTIKNRVACLRWWAEHIGKPSIIPNDNLTLGIPNRSYVTNVSKARELDAERLAQVN